MGSRVSIMAKFYPVGPLRSGPDCSKSSPPGNVLSAEFAEAGRGCTKKLSQNLAQHTNRHCHENSRFHIHTRPNAAQMAIRNSREACPRPRPGSGNP